MRLDTTWAAILIVLFVILPRVSNTVLYAFHHPVIIFITVLALLWLTTKSPVLGILGLLCFGGLYLERNRRTLFTALGIASSAPRMPQDAEMPLSPSQRFIAYEEPEVASVPFAPGPGMGSDSFSPVGTSIDAKRPPLPTVPPGEATGYVLLKAWPVA
jgi:hypothetical protein